jgi:PrtD family type I secretion system ABC transporter
VHWARLLLSYAVMNAPSANPANAVTQTLARLKPLLWQIGLVFSPVVNILVLTSSLYMMQVFDRVLTSQSTSTLLYLTLLALAALALMSAVELVRSRIMTRIGTWIEARLTAEGLQRAVEATLTGHPYRIDLLRDLAGLRNFFTTPGTLTLFDVPWIPVYLIVVYAIHPMLGHIALFGAVALFGLAIWNDKASHKQLTDSAIMAQKNFRDADAAIRNAEALDVMGMTPGLLHRWRSENDRIQTLQLTASDQSGSIMAISRFTRQALQIMVLAVGAELVLSRDLTSGGMIACSIIIARALAPVESAMGSWRQTLAAFDSYKRLKLVFDKPLLRATTMELPRPKGNLTVEGVSYVPQGSKVPIIRGVSFAIKAGTVTAVVGPSAAGKSTLARLCVGAYPPSYGNVRLDGADVFLWERSNFAPHVGYLPQGVELFAGTVRENISRLQPAEPNEVVEAAQLAGAHDLILRLPQGYETEIGEGGALLSAGQRQRIALARTVFRNPQFVVMDEPNSSLDAEGEDALNRAIAALKQRGATVLVIGHRPGILAHADNIIVLREGHIEMSGPKAEILAKIMPQNQGKPPPPKVERVGESA